MPESIAPPWKRRILVAGAAAVALTLAAIAGGASIFRSSAHRVPADGEPHVMSVWSRETSPGKTPLRALCAPSNDRGLPPIAVGDDGVLLIRGGDGTWVPAQSPTKARLNAVSSDYDAFAVGENGTILHYERARREWLVEQSGTREHLYGVATPEIGPAAVAVGAHGTILERTGTNGNGYEWRRAAVTTTADLFAARVLYERLIVVGAEGTVLASQHIAGTFDPLVFTAQETPTRSALHGATYSEGAGILLGGVSGTLLNAEGARPWAVVPLPASGDVQAIAHATLTEGTVLPNGAIFRGLRDTPVVVIDDRLYARPKSNGEGFAEVPVPRMPRRITALASVDQSLLAVTEAGEIWRLSATVVEPVP